MYCSVSSIDGTQLQRSTFPSPALYAARAMRSFSDLNAHAIAARAGVDFVDVLLGLVDRRDAVAALDFSFAGVVRGEGDALVFEAIEEVAEVARAGGDVLGGIEDVCEAEVAGGLGDDLHESLRAAMRHKAGTKIGFGVHHRRDQLRRESVLARLAIDDRSVRHVHAEELLLERIDRHALLHGEGGEKLLAHPRSGEDRHTGLQ